MKMLNLMFGGLCMALADSVPGVSGGTILFILGIYDKFISSLNSLVSRDKINQRNRFKFLVKLGMGWIIGFCIGIYMVIPNFEYNIYKISSLFIGFIVFSISVIIKGQKENIVDKYHNIIFTVIGILVVVLITYFNPISSNSYNISFKYFDIGLMIYIMLVAIIAVSAMVLPGISGSTLLLIFGLYLPIMKSVHNILNGNFSQMPIVLVFIVGLIIGIFSFTKLVKYLLQKYTSEIIYIILGLMIGSIYSIIMGPTTIIGTYNYVPVNIYNFNVLFFILGGVLIGAIQYLKHFILKQSTDMNLKEID
ncbi:MAG: DUF368 domain-containing protein [Clostridiales bacterium]|nr:DUF368 domain-containing protein [Clostridiales bacterium]